MIETSTGRLAAAEFVATLILMLGGPGLIILGGADIGPLGVALGFGASIAIAIGVIGGVANPMFSLALWFSKGIATRELVADWIGQFAGAIAGGLLIYGMNDTDRFTAATNGWQPGDSLDAGVDAGIHLTGFADLGVVLAAELVLGTIVVVVLLSAISHELSKAAVGAYTGAAYAVATLFLLNISGAGINPARSLGTALFADTDPNALVQLWAFVLVPIGAAFAGTVIWLGIDDATIDETVFDDTFLEDAGDAVTHDA